MNVRPLILLVALMPCVALAQNTSDATSGSVNPALEMHGAAVALGTSPSAPETGQQDTATSMIAMQGATTAPNAPDATLPDGNADRSCVAKPDIPNPAIDMDAYLRVSSEAAAHRQSHRVSEEDFLRMSREPGTIVLDARSAAKYGLLHVKGAINLSFPDITVASLKQTIPDKSTHILIYCNNNFSGAEKPFPTKLASTSLNLSTYIALYN